MKNVRETFALTLDRRAALVSLAAVLLLAGAGFVASQQLTMTATYPVPSGVYNQILTTGSSGAAAANTTLNRDGGNTILVPPTNAAGILSIGATALASKLSVEGGIQPGDDASVCGAANDGTLRWHLGQFEACYLSAYFGARAWRSLDVYQAHGFFYAPTGACSDLPYYPRRLTCNTANPMPYTGPILHNQYPVGTPCSTYAQPTPQACEYDCYGKLSWWQAKDTFIAQGISYTTWVCY